VFIIIGIIIIINSVIVLLPAVELVTLVLDVLLWPVEESPRAAWEADAVVELEVAPLLVASY
jgi:hypothetical protein